MATDAAPPGQPGGCNGQVDLLVATDRVKRALEGS
jgi:hypothetical protein